MTLYVPTLRPDPLDYVRVGVPVQGTLTQDYYIDFGTALSDRFDLGPEQRALTLEKVTGFTNMELQEEERRQGLPLIMRANAGEAMAWFRLPFNMVNSFLQTFYENWWFLHSGKDWTIRADGNRAPVIERLLEPSFLKEAHLYAYHSPLVLRYEPSGTTLVDNLRLHARELGLAPETVHLVWVRESDDEGHYEHTTYTGVGDSGYGRKTIEGFQVLVVGDFGKKKSKGYGVTAITKLLTWGMGDGRLYGCGAFTPVPRSSVGSVVGMSAELLPDVQEKVA